MTNIIIHIPKYRIAKSNRLRWKFNKHKKPFYFISEINKAIRKDNELKFLFKEYYKGFYDFKKRGMWND